MAFIGDNSDYGFGDPGAGNLPKNRGIGVFPGSTFQGGPAAVPDPTATAQPTGPLNWNTGGPYTGAMTLNPTIPGVPQFNAPRFQSPTGVTDQNDPGYQFRLQQGEGALQASAAARGVLNSGGTLQDVLKYGQDYASQEYSNVFNRALQGYQANYQAARDQYAPNFAQWQNTAANSETNAQLAFQRAWDQYTFGINDQFRNLQLAGTIQQPQGG